MPLWDVRTADQHSRVEAANWMTALGAAFQGPQALRLSSLVCDVQPDGAVLIRDAQGEASVSIRPVLAPTLQVVAVAAPPPADWEEDSVSPPPEALAEEPTAAFLPDFTMPGLPSRFAPHTFRSIPPPTDLAERLFDETGAIAAAQGAQAAASAALAILQRHVPAESGAVLQALGDDRSLHFLAATGPVAPGLRAHSLPGGAGIAGFCDRTGASLIVQDALMDPRHFSEIDLSTGYDTRSVLAVALVDSGGTVHGCLELINPPAAFTAAHLDLARVVANSLAEVLAHHH